MKTDDPKKNYPITPEVLKRAPKGDEANPVSKAKTYLHAMLIAKKLKKVYSSKGKSGNSEDNS